MIEDPIIITGHARSGTSLTAGLIHLAGAWKGTTTKGNEDNPKGYFENRKLKPLCYDALESIGADRWGIEPLPHPDMISTLAYRPSADFRDEVISRIRDDGYQRGAWFYKEAKALLLWPLWHAAFPRAKWIIVRRAEQGVVNSCLNTRFMSQRSTDRRFWRQWYRYHLKRIADVQARVPNWRSVYPGQIARGEFESLEFALKWLGLPFNEYESAEFVEDRYWLYGG